MNLSNKAKLDCYIARLPTDQFVSVHCGSVDNLEKRYLLPPPPPIVNGISQTPTTYHKGVV